MFGAETLQQTSQSAMHLLSDDELRGKKVSSASEWHSPAWDIDNPTHGSTPHLSRVRWEIELADGILLTDSQNHKLLDWLRRVIWGVLAAPGDGASPLAPGSLGHVSIALSRVVPWLVENRVLWPREMTPEVLDQFLNELPERLARSGGSDDEGDEDEASVSLTAARSAITVFYYIWRQRRALSEAGIEPMPAAPWPDVDGANTLAKRIADQVQGWIQPLPDEVAVPLLNRMMWFLGTPAQDVLKIRDILDEAYEQPRQRHGRGKTRCARVLRQRTVAQKITFSVVPGEDAPWHRPLSTLKYANGSAAMVRGFRRLVIDLQAACCIALQGLTGMRASELCSLRAGIDQNTGLPVDVEMRLSASGLNEEFILCGELSKKQASPQPVPWLLGIRRVGDPELPTGVRAIVLLDKLLGPYRALLGSDRLLVSIKSQTGLPRTRAGVHRMTGGRVNSIYRNFVRRWVDLSNLSDESRNATSSNNLAPWRDTKGDVITSHQLRKTYGLFVLSVHPDLLPAVKRQYHHISMQITENSYWGSDSAQIEPIHSVSRQLTARMLFAATQGSIKLVGHMGKQIDSNIDQLRQLVAGLDKPAAWIRVHRWVEENRLDATHSAHGACIPITGSRMECWKKVGLRPIGRLEPNYATREASLCAGCGCFSIHPGNTPFWRERYIANEVSLRLAEKDFREVSSHRVIRNRASQARKILNDLGLDSALLEVEVQEKVAAHD